jgi:hypothetical protein
MTLKLTGFNPLHPSDDSQPVEIDSEDISVKVGSMTGDRQPYTSITTKIGELFMVRETIQQIDDMIGG